MGCNIHSRREYKPIDKFESDLHTSTSRSVPHNLASATPGTHMSSVPNPSKSSVYKEENKFED